MNSCWLSHAARGAAAYGPSFRATISHAATKQLGSHVSGPASPHGGTTDTIIFPNRRLHIAMIL